MITALAGGVGAARLLRGLVRVVPASEVTVIVNTGDDMVFCGLSISPDIDSVTRMLAGTFDEARGFGRVDESFTVMGEVAALGGETWFSLGDRDLATHMIRSRRLEQGATLSAVTAELARATGVSAHLLPVTDDPIRTRVRLAGGTGPEGDDLTGSEVSFQEYFARLHHGVPVHAIRVEGAASARPAPGVLEAIGAAETVVLCPSNPVLSIGPLLAVPGVREAVARRRDDVVAVSPLIGGRAVKGPTDHLMVELGMEPSVVGVARAYAGLAGTLCIDEEDAALASAVEAEGLRAVVAPTLLDTAEAAAALCRVLLADRPAP